jgi:FkbM family methyltransferase
MNKIQRLVRHVDRIPEILTAARTIDRFLPVTLEYLDAKAIGYPMDARLQNGLRVRLTEREEVKILWHIFVRKCYGVRGNESVILDLGANVGFFALYAATNAPAARIYSAEQVPATFQRLTRHLEWNGLTARVTALNCAVVGHEGKRFMAAENVPAGQQRLLAERREHAGSGIEVSGSTLESLLERYNLDSVDLAKVDIEGSEYEVLLSTPLSVLRRIARMDLEIHNNITAQGHTASELMEHLRAAGLALASIETDAQGFSQARFLRQN